MDINELLQRVGEYKCFPSLQRRSYQIDLKSALAAVEAIGKSRCGTFVIDNENRFVYENLLLWAHGQPFKCLSPTLPTQIIEGNLSKGIYIGGETGTGKSWALEILSAYCLVMGFQISINGKARPLGWVNMQSQTICNNYATTGTVQGLNNASIIGIQDLGAEMVETLYMGNRTQIMRQLIETRADRQDNLTNVTANYPIYHNFLKDRYADRVMSRLPAMCNYFELHGKDRRV